MYLYCWQREQATLQVSQNIEEIDRELAMELSPLVLQWEESSNVAPI